MAEWELSSTLLCFYYHSVRECKSFKHVAWAVAQAWRKLWQYLKHRSLYAEACYLTICTTLLFRLQPALLSLYLKFFLNNLFEFSCILKLQFNWLLFINWVEVKRRWPAARWIDSVTWVMKDLKNQVRDSSSWKKSICVVTKSYQQFDGT